MKEYEKYLNRSRQPVNLAVFEQLTNPKNYQEINGDLVELAKEGFFDVIAHGCNCFCRMKSGIAVPMSDNFSCDTYPMENRTFMGDFNKLGMIDFQLILKMQKDLGFNFVVGRKPHLNHLKESLDFYRAKELPCFYVVNAYTQYMYGKELKPFDYDAFVLCLKKMNHYFKDMHVGLPQIGAGLAGGDWDIIKDLIKKYLFNCKVTIIIFNK